MHKILFFLLATVSLSYGAVVVANDNSEQFPKRKYYPQLNYIETQEFANGLKKHDYDVIDVRSETSFKALHVKSAANIYIKSKTFDQEILNFAKQSNNPFVVYCNGISCSKSYEASKKIINLLKKMHVKKRVLTYDSGINAIAYAHNEFVLKDGKAISKTNPLISLAKIEEHTLKPVEFENYLTEHSTDEYVMLDIRNKSEKIILKLFMFHREKNITLDDRTKLITFLNKIKEEGKTLLVYDASGRQINGLYELLNITGIEKWHYMEGGEFGYSK